MARRRVPPYQDRLPQVLKRIVEREGKLSQRSRFEQTLKQIMVTWLLKTVNRGLKHRRFGRCTSTESETFSPWVCLDANNFLLVSLFILVATIWPKVWAKSLTKNVRGPLPVDMRLSKTSLLELPNVLLTVLRYFPGMIIELFIYTKIVPIFIAVAKFVSCLPCIVPRRVG